MASKHIPHTNLGKNGPSVPVLGLGAISLCHSTYGSIPNDEERFAFLDRAYELGCTFWDCADLYGDCEEFVGKWFKRTGKRNEIFLASKFGFIKGSKTFEVDSSGEYCKKACEESLKAFDVDCIDLYYMHHANPETPIEETMRALKELQDEGKIKHIGLSAISSATLRRAVKIAPVACVQAEYSPFVLDVEGPKGTHLLETCRELGVTLVCATPLGRGMLTSTFASGEAVGDEKDLRPRVMPRFSDENRETNVKIMSQFKALAEKKGCTITQLALAWLMKQGNDVIPIPGTKRIKYLEENWASLDVHLTDEDDKELRQFMESTQIAGHYMPDQFSHYSYRDTKEEA
ncbi:NADP-dependent oxidoreductase domain-containing protein [Mariannaea sp. PMI_226]|nr:NADP-dependent oxidoreductase domain-containing protein [Mariannaea sp. PMI_226]